MIRRMNESDIESVMPLIRSHFMAVNMDERLNTYDDITARESLIKAVNNMVTFINDDGGDINGIITYSIYPSLFNRYELRAAEMLWYARSPKVMLKLHNHMMDFIKTDVNVISVGIPTNNDLGHFLIRDDFILTEYVFSKKGGKKNV